jgi:hypothetical protein
MKLAGYRAVRRCGSAIYFDCIDTAAKRAFYRRRYIACDHRVKHPLAVQQSIAVRLGSGDDQDLGTTSM